MMDSTWTRIQILDYRWSLTLNEIVRLELAYAEREKVFFLLLYRVPNFFTLWHLMNLQVTL